MKTTLWKFLFYTSDFHTAEFFYADTISNAWAQVADAVGRRSVMILKVELVSTETIIFKVSESNNYQSFKERK